MGTDGWTDERVDGRAGGRTSGWTDERVAVELVVCQAAVDDSEDVGADHETARSSQASCGQSMADGRTEGGWTDIPGDGRTTGGLTAPKSFGTE